MINVEQFRKALEEENLDRIDECIHGGLRINQIHDFNEYDSISRRYYVSSFVPLIYAVNKPSITVVRHLLKRGGDVLIKLTRYSETPLSVAVKMGNLEMVKLLVENGAKPTMQTALLDAIKTRNLDIVKYLIEEGVCINWEYADGDTPLSTSIKNECEEIAKFLIDDGNTAKSTIQGAFLFAIKNRGLDIVEKMVEKGVSVNWEYAKGDTPLSTSIESGCEDISKFLIDNGANLEQITDRKSTPLILSVENRMLDTFKYLIKKGANIDQIDNNGRTALCVAANKMNLGCAKYLIESGADINLAQKAVDEYARGNEDFRYFLKIFTMKQEQLKSSSSDIKEASSTTDNKCLHCILLLKLSNKESGFGQEEASPPEK